MSNSTQLAVILCTYNRARSLAKTLESIVVQTLPPSVEWEILVVDNNSRDETRKVVEDFQRRYPQRVRYFLEPQQGVSHARNAGIRNAKGDILAFIDDDEAAATGWLQHLTSNLVNGEWSGAGGRVVPLWSCSRPRWLTAESPFITAPLALFDADPKREQLSEPPFGANMAFRRKTFEQYGGFRTDLGRSGKNLLSNEDTEFGRRVLAAGERLRYEPSAVTYHPVEEYRLRREYFLMWWFSKGRSDVREIGIQARGGTSFLGIRLNSLRHLAVEALRWTTSIDPSQRFVEKLKVWASAGEVYEAFCQAIEEKRRSRKRRSQSSVAGGR